DVLVRCSDGLSGQVHKEEIAEIVTGARDLQAAADRLIALANERGGPDNITVVIARFDGDGLRPASAHEEVGHQVYPLIATETSTEPVPVYPGSPPPLPTPRARWPAPSPTLRRHVALAAARASSTGSARGRESAWRAAGARAARRARHRARPGGAAPGSGRRDWRVPSTTAARRTRERGVPRCPWPVA